MACSSIKPGTVTSTGSALGTTKQPLKRHQSLLLLGRLAFASNNRQASRVGMISASSQLDNNENGSHNNHQGQQASKTTTTTTRLSSSPFFQQACKSLTSLAAAVALLANTAAVIAVVPPPAHAVLNSPNARIPRTVDAALRRSIPAFNEDVHTIQTSLEDMQFKLRIPQRKPWNAMADDLANCLTIAGDDGVMLRGVLKPDVQRAQELVADIRIDLDRLSQAVALKDADRTSIRLSKALNGVADLELLQAPGLPFNIPKQYAGLPLLTGRAVVMLEFERKDGRPIFVDPDSEDGPQKRGKLELTIDGYSAPLTGGNFVANVLAGVYNNCDLTVTSDSIIMGSQGKNIGALPLEMLPAGEFAPIYRSPLDVLGGELPVLPLSIYGSAAMTHLPGADSNVGFVSSRQFFLYRYARQASGLSGLSFDEGQFPVFGYITRGAELLSKLEQGDSLVSAQLVAGKERLVLGETQQAVPDGAAQ